MDSCLWVRDALIKKDRGYNFGLDPESVRCHANGKVFCRPCWNKFFGGK